MRKFVIELREVLTYNLVVEAEDHDDAFEVAMRTRKYCENDHDENDTECGDVTEVPEDVAHEYELDEILHERTLSLIHDDGQLPYAVEKKGHGIVARFGDYDAATEYILAEDLR